MARRFLFHALVLGGALAVAGCSRKDPEAARGEAGQVARAVEQLRMAGNEAKRPFLKALQAAACTAGDVCELKDACVAAYEREQAALDALAAVSRELRGGGEIAAETVELLGRAQQDLDAAHDQTKACADLEGRLRRTYRL